MWIENWRQLFFNHVEDRRISTSPDVDNAIYRDYRLPFLKEIDKVFTMYISNRVIISNTGIKVSGPFKLPTMEEGLFPFLVLRIVDIFATFVGILARAIFLVFNWSYIKKTNDLITRKLQQQAASKQKVVLCKEKNFNQKESQRCKINCCNNKILSLKILPFLSVGDLQSFAQSSTGNYRIVAKNPLVRQCTSRYEKYPCVVLNVLGAKNIDQIKRRCKILQQQSKEEDEIAGYAQLILGRYGCQDVTLNWYRSAASWDEISAKALEFQQTLKFTIRNLSDTKFAVKIKDNRSQKEQAIVLSEDGLEHPYWFLPYHLWLFLNEWDRSPKVLDYLARLRKGEPCGRFPKELNAHIPYDDTRENLANLLQEGPVCMEDGTTPVIQLCPSERLQYALS